LNRFRQFIEYESLYLPGKEYLRRLESRIGYKQNEVCTNFKENLTTHNFLYACGYLDQNGNQTRKFKSSPRIKLYHQKKEREQIDRHRAAAESQKIQAAAQKEKRKLFITRIKKIALGQWSDLVED